MNPFQPAASHHSALAAAAAAMKAHEMPPGSYHHHPHPAAVGIGHHQLMDMYSGMTPATAINTMDWKNTSQVGHTHVVNADKCFISVCRWFYEIRIMYSG